MLLARLLQKPICCCPALMARLKRLTGISTVVSSPPAISASAHQARPLVVERPTRDEELHRGRVVARAEAMLLVELVRRRDPRHVDLDAEAGRIRHPDQSAGDAQRLLGQPLAVLPD